MNDRYAYHNSDGWTEIPQTWKYHLYDTNDDLIATQTSQQFERTLTFAGIDQKVATLTIEGPTDVHTDGIYIQSSYNDDLLTIRIEQPETP